MNAATSHPTPHVSDPLDREPPDWSRMTLAERDVLRVRAMARAHALRAEAIADFWRGTDAWLADAVDHTRRAADRLAARLRQHAKRRAPHESRALEA